MKKRRIQSLMGMINTEIINFNHKKSLSSIKPSQKSYESSFSSSRENISSSKDKFKINAVIHDENEISNLSHINSSEENIESNTSFKPSSYKKIDPLENKRQKENDIINKILESEQALVDNDYDTNEYFIKLKQDDFITAYLTLFSIITGVIYHDMTHANDFENKELIRDINLILTSILSLLFIICSLNRYINILRLDKSSNVILKNTSFWSFSYFGNFFIEMIFALLHPNYFTKNKVFTTNKSYYIVETQYEINDMLLVVLITRIYVIFRHLISNSRFYSARSARIAKLIGSEVNKLFVIKCYVLMNPIQFLIVCTGSFIVSTAYLLRIAEGAAYNEDMGLNDYRNYLNCAWNVIVTMTTVGYGDYYPITNLGRLVNIFVSIWGTFLTSLMVVALQNLLVFTDNEDKAFNYGKKQEQKEMFEKHSVKLFKAAFKYNNAKRRYKKASELNLSKAQLDKLRKEIDIALNKRAKAWREYKNQFHFYRNTYEVLNETDLLKEKMDAFQNQLDDIDANTDRMEDYVKRMKKVVDEIEDKIEKQKYRLEKPQEEQKDTSN